jgi:hypothetical protein
LLSTFISPAPTHARTSPTSDAPVKGTTEVRVGRARRAQHGGLGSCVTMGTGALLDLTWREAGARVREETTGIGDLL